MRKTLSVTYEPPPSPPLRCLDGKLTCQVQTPRLSDPRLCREQAKSPSWPGEGQVSTDGSRTHTPDAASLYSFLGQAATFFKGTWDFTSNLRSLNIPPATAANEPRCPEGPRISGPHAKLQLGRLLGTSTPSDQLKQQRMLTLAQVASSLAGGYFCRISPWWVVKEALVSWVNAPRAACRIERKHV